MFIIAALLSSLFETGGRPRTPIPTRFEIVDTVGHLPAEKGVPAREYVIVQLPDSSLHYGLIAPTGELTDWVASPIPQWSELHEPAKLK